MNLKMEQHRDDTSSDKASVTSSSTAVSFIVTRANSTLLFTALIVVLGLITSAAFTAIGLNGVFNDQKKDYDRSASAFISSIESSFEDYVNAASLVHARCRGRDFTRTEFKEFYEYLLSSGLRFKAVQFDPNITHEKRPAAEEEARQYYAENYPEVDYQGFRGFNTLNSTTLEPRTNQSFYFPIHYNEPVAGNTAALGLDYHSSESRMRALYAVFDNKAPSLTDRLSLVRQANQRSRCGDHDGPSYGIVLMHPGVELTTPDPDEIWPRDISTIVLCIPDLLARASSVKELAASVYIHDLSHLSDDPVFMGGAIIDPNEEDLVFLDEISLDELEVDLPSLSTQTIIRVANREWLITVIDEEGRYDSTIIFVALGGAFILLATLFLAIWMRTNEMRNRKYTALRAATEREKAALILDNARQATKTERELNDFIAHEVRNPVAAAMTACNFVDIAIHKEQPLSDQESIDLAREDINIINNSLHFVNDLLRNMLDMHRAASKQLQVTMAPVDLLHDVLEPVGGMLYQRGSKVKLIVECPPDFFIMADCLRLKQVILNLGRNSVKFIDEGFIRLKAEEVDGVVKIYVDDSGSGIPESKRERLFAKFQESLDLLSQGTGIGLFLCKSLVELMGGKIYLDNDYTSGVPGYPGTRFVVDLQAGTIEPPLTKDLFLEEGKSGGTGTTQGMAGDMDSIPLELPEKLSILFVDDDSVLRKLFSRSVKTVRPDWKIREAGNGETALRLIETEQFDMIFVDMYMASVEKQLLGTETVAALRNLGCTSRICGLSANDKEDEFFEAGADAFLFKPFPCERMAMVNALCKVLYEDRHAGLEGSV